MRAATLRPCGSTRRHPSKPADATRQDTTTGQDRTGHDTIRLDVATAAQRLGITEDAVRKRIHRGKLQAIKVDNQWLVIVDTTETRQDGTGPQDTTGRDATRQDDEPIEAPYRVAEEPSQRSIVTDIGQRQLEILRDTLLAPLIEDNRVLRTEVGDLRERTGRLEAERDAERQRADALQAQIESLHATRKSASAVNDAGATQPQTQPQEPPGRPWWKFWKRLGG